MTGDVEEIVSRELREVAGSLQVPAMPALPRQPERRPWRPLLAAAAAVAVVAGGVAVVADRADGPEPSPAPTPASSAPPSSAPPSSAPASPRAVPRTPPTVPYVLDRGLYVDGVKVPGEWWSVEAGESGWLALRADNTWWWGWDPEPHEIEGSHDTPPVISPDGKYVAYTTVENGTGMVTGFDTKPAGEGLGGVPVDLGDRQDGSLVTVRAVTDDGKVVVQGSRTALLWTPLVLDSSGPVDLTQSAPGQQVLAGTPAGLVVTDGTDSTDGQPYLAEISDAGELTRTQDLPAYDSISVSRGGSWVAWMPPGTLGGEVTTVATLEAQRVDGRAHVALSAPDGWSFRVGQWAWEDDDYLVATVTPDGGSGRDRMARCLAASARCVLVGSR